MKKMLLTAIAATGLLGACAANDLDNRVAGSDVQVWDADNDGFFEEGEYAAFGEQFATWDDDANGWLDNDEFDAGWREVGFDDSDGAFDTFDDDDNGWLGEDEFFNDDDFGVWDNDDDDRLGPDEWGF